MDPLAHTLVGAALAETGLKKLSRYAAPTLIIGANLPDVDAIATFWGGDTALYFRRGWSHGVLALLILPLLLAGTIWLWHRWRGYRSPHAPPLRTGAIVALSFLAVWSHPLLDWLNTYGVRLLMPFDGRWFYGDTLFIVDPWVWLLAAAGVVLARSTSHLALAGWVLLGGLTTLIILMTTLVPLPVKVLWLLGLSAIVFTRWRMPSQTLQLLVARASFSVLVLYLCVAYGLARVAESTIAARYPTPLEAQANPIPGVPTAHRVVLVYDDLYRVIMADGKVLEVPRQEPNAIVLAALEADSVRGFANWMRYPYWEITETETHWVVHFRDLRYLNPGETTRGVIGLARVEVLKDQAVLNEKEILKEKDLPKK
jgi:inner membrane protein